MRGALLLWALATPLMAGAVCLPPSPAAVVLSTNAKGTWIGWWCSRNDPYIAACATKTCSNAGVQAAIRNFLAAPRLEALTFGRDVWADPGMLAIWQPERAKLLALRPAR